MKKLLLVIRHEFITVVTRRSFLLTLFLVPLGAFLLMGIINLVKQANQSSSGEEILAQLLLPNLTSTKEGFVDEANVIHLFSGKYEKDLTQFADEPAARVALSSGEITSYYILPPDYLATGNIINVRNDFNPLTAVTTSGNFLDLVNYNLLKGDEQTSQRLVDPAHIRSMNLQPLPERDRGSVLTFLLPYAVTMIFYLVIMGSATLMLNSVSKEKVNRVMEILMTSTTPRQLLAGKIVALGMAGLLQTIVWMATGYALLGSSRSMFNLSSAFQLSPSILVWGIFFFIGGYSLYATLMGGVGAMVPNLREAAQTTTILVLPMVIPLVLINSLIYDPNGALSIFFSLFPLTSPAAMMTRLAATTVPVWQLLLSLGILFSTVFLCMRSIANIFHAQTLLSGQTFNLKYFVKVLFGKS
jgi:ABC-2 type transport system permease protein